MITLTVNLYLLPYLFYVAVFDWARSLTKKGETLETYGLKHIIDISVVACH